MKVSANTCTLSMLKPPEEAELVSQFFRQSCCQCVQGRLWVRQKRGVNGGCSLGVSAGLLSF